MTELLTVVYVLLIILTIGSFVFIHKTQDYLETQLNKLDVLISLIGMVVMGYIAYGLWFENQSYVLIGLVILTLTHIYSYKNSKRLNTNMFSKLLDEEDFNTYLKKQNRSLIITNGIVITTTLVVTLY